LVAFFVGKMLLAVELANRIGRRLLALRVISLR
jgi:hypothetical protein